MIEIRIKSSGEKLVLSQGTSIKSIRKNSAFDPGSVLADYSMPFKLPIKGNETLLGWQHLIESAINPEDIDVYVSFKGIDFFKGALRYMNSDRYFFNVQLVTSKNDVSPETPIQSLFTRQVVFSYPSAITPRDVNDDGYPKYRYVFGSFTNVKDEFINKYATDWVNQWSGGALITAPAPPATDPKPLNISLYLFYVLQELCSSMGFEARGDLFRDKELEKLVVFNNWIFEWDNGFTVDESNLVPSITLGEFFEGIASMGVSINVNPNSKVISFDLLKNLSGRTDLVDLTDKAEYEYSIDYSEKLSLKVSQNISDGYANSVIQRVKGQDSGNTFPYPQDLTSPPVEENKFGYVSVEESHYKVTQQSPLEMERFHQNPDYQFGDGERSINIPETLLVAIHQGYANALIPKCDFEWSDQDQVSDFPLQLLFYRGMQVSRSSLTYPALTGSNLVTNSIGFDYFEESGSLKLSPAGENGWAVKMYMDWAQRLAQTKVVKRKFQLLITDLITLNMNQPVRIYSSHFIIKDISTTMLQSGQTMCELSLLRL